MEKAVSKEFTIGLSNVEGCQKFTPSSLTYNGVKGYLWTKRILAGGRWVHVGKQHVRKGAHEVEIAAAFVIYPGTGNFED